MCVCVVCDPPADVGGSSLLHCEAVLVAFFVHMGHVLHHHQLHHIQSHT